MDNAPFAFVRCSGIQTLGDLSKLEAHGKGLGSNAKERRCVTEPNAPRALFYRWDERDIRPGRVGTKIATANAKDAFGELLSKNDAKVRGGTRIGLNLIVGVGPEWLDDPDDPDDDNYRRNPRRNKRIPALMRAAIDWANAEFGADGIPACYAARCDLDERRCANVDLFIAPIRAEVRSGNRFVSPTKALTEFANRHDFHASRSFTPMQDSWAAYASKHLGTVFRRGERAEKTRRQHLSPEDLKGIAQRAAKDEAGLRKELAELRAAADKAVEQGSIEPLLALKDAEHQRRLPKAPKPKAWEVPDFLREDDGNLPVGEMDRGQDG